MKLLPVARYLQTAHLFITKTEINWTNENKSIISNTIDSRTLSFSFRKGNSGTVEKSKDVFQKGVRFTEECDIWCGQQKKS